MSDIIINAGMSNEKRFKHIIIRCITQGFLR